jgi:inner membrane protein YhjD
VQQRYSELRGNNIASAVTLQAFVSIFPLMLVIVGVLGFISAGSSSDVAGKIIANLGLNGDAAMTVRNAVHTAETSRQAASVVGLAGLLWSGLGLVNALQYAFNQVWQVEERGIKDKAVGLGWLVGAAVIFVGASAVTTVIRWLPGFFAPLGIITGLAVNFVLWLWTAKVLPNRDVGWRPLVPGALLGAVGMEVLKVLGGLYVPRAVAHSSELYGSIGIVFAILAWLLLFGRLILYSAVLNVVLYEKDRGTIKTTIEVPATPHETPDETTRSGRVEKEDINT